MEVVMKRIYVLALLLVSAAASAEIYKWKDASGNWQYSDQPPPAAVKGKATVVKTKDQPVSAMPGTKVNPVSTATASSAAAETASAPKKVNPQACQEAQIRLRFLQGATQMRMTNEKGVTEFLPAEKKKEEIAAAQKRIEDNCE
ncbi:hypothetical protein IGB42_02180 [Andreprevotia sp. IGB-42]|nr:hypothetical protein IGB42_02180 [Andreprevotia sp. IGB-42]